jgi:hypothetical protein
MTSVNAKQEALLDELLKDYTDPQDIRSCACSLRINTTDLG